ncbi:MAG: hypothetical protein OJF52_000892 [Nitrospira sp.]|jgi:hypothetical protein|nr:MAG: hypothetical protein OJF52_000892 [Nitrospira sp.]
MPERLPSHFIDLVQDALLKSFWRKNALLNFLRRHKIAESFLATWQETETKRAFIGRLFPKLESDSKGANVIRQMGASLSDQVKFPDLEGWEDAHAKIQAAKEAMAALRHYLHTQKLNADDAKAREDTRKAAHQRMQETIRKRQSLETLSEKLKELSRRIGSAEAGYEFQDWFFDVVDFFEMTNRRPYSSGGRQIDGSITVEGTTYLTELKFTREQVGAPDVDTFLAKVNDKADNTMGIMVSMSGYSSTAVEQASGRKTPIILLDHGHVYLILSGSWTLEEVVSRVRRHASQTARAFLPASEFGA